MKSIQVTDALDTYIENHNPHFPQVLLDLAAETDALSCAQLRTPNLQVQFIQFILRSRKFKKILEIGTFTGLTTLAMALAANADAEINTCDINTTYPAIGQVYWQKAAVTKRIKLIVGPAIDTLATFKKDQQQFDFIYIDADKRNYWQYFLLSIDLLTQHGLLMVDNVLWRGEVASTQMLSKQAAAMDHFNTELAKRTDINYCILPIADGLTLISKK